MQGIFYVVEIIDCEACLGTGCESTGIDNDKMPCNHCHGTGEIRNDVPLRDALIALGVMDVIDRANQAAERAAYEASCLANGILPD